VSGTRTNSQRLEVLRTDPAAPAFDELVRPPQPPETPSATQAERWLNRKSSFGRHGGVPTHRAGSLVSTATVLVLHPDEQHAKHLTEMVHISGLEASYACDSDAAVAMITHHRPDLVLAAASLGEHGAESGLAGLLGLARSVGVRVVVLTDRYAAAERDELLRLGACDYLPVGLPLDELVVRLWWHVRPDDPRHRYLLNSRSHLMVEVQRAGVHPSEGAHVLARVDFAEREDLRNRLGDAAVRATDRQLTQRLASARPAGSLVAPDVYGGTLVLLRDAEPSHPVWELSALCLDLAMSGRESVTPVLGYQLVSRAWSAEAVVRRAGAACTAARVRGGLTPVDADTLPPVPVQATPSSPRRRSVRDTAAWRMMRRAASTPGAVLR
jgi:DNA-binding response OmpR family regulator